MKGFESIIKTVKDVSESLKENGDENVLNALAEAGELLIKTAYETKETGDKFLNQHDAYGYAVFYAGKEKRRGYLDPEMSTDDVAEQPGVRGRAEIDKALDAFTSHGEGYTLVIMNAMSYSLEQEEGIEYEKDGDSIIRKWKILSQVFGSMEEVGAYFEENGFTAWTGFYM